MYSTVDSLADELLTKRLRLRPPRRADLEPLHAAIEETLPDLVQWLPWARPGHVRLDSRRYLRGARNAWSKRSAFEFVIEEERGGLLVGVASLHRIDWSRRSAGLGYWVRRSRWGRGYAPEAAEALANHGFGRLGLHRIEIHIAEHNRASHAVATKLGAVREGLARDSEFINGAFVTHVQYSLLSSDRHGGP